MRVPRELVPGNLVLLSHGVLDWYFDCQPFEVFASLFVERDIELALVLDCKIIEHVFAGDLEEDPLTCVLLLVEFLVNGAVAIVLFRISGVHSSDVDWEATGSLEVENFLRNFTLLSSKAEDDECLSREKKMKDPSIEK